MMVSLSIFSQHVFLESPLFVDSSRIPCVTVSFQLVNEIIYRSFVLIGFLYLSLLLVYLSISNHKIIYRFKSRIILLECDVPVQLDTVIATRLYCLYQTDQ